MNEQWRNNEVIELVGKLWKRRGRQTHCSFVAYPDFV